MTLTRQISGANLRLNCADNLAPQGRAVLDAFERLYGSEALNAGAQIWFGWSLLQVQEDQSGLVVCEPDFDRLPAETWRPVVNTTLSVASEQVRLLRHLGLPGKDAPFNTIIFAVPGALDLEDVFLKRTVARLEGDSGWALGPLSNPEALGGDELDAIVIAKLVQSHAYLLPCLALPPGSIAVFERRELRDILDAGGKRIGP